MRFGLVQMRLTPEQFWLLTPAELALIAGADGAGAMSRSGLGDMMSRYPDKKE